MARPGQRKQSCISKPPSQTSPKRSTPFLSILFLGCESVPHFLLEGQEDEIGIRNASSAPPLLVLSLKSKQDIKASLCGISLCSVCWRKQCSVTSGCASWGSVLHEDSCPVVPMLGSDPLPLRPPSPLPSWSQLCGKRMDLLSSPIPSYRGKEQLLLSPSPEMSPPPLLLSRTFIAGWEIENKRSKLLSVWQ